jgi:intraflagellar transport protein 88
MGNYRQAIKWLEFLNTLVPNDPGVLARLGAIHAKYDDEAKALHFYQESHRVYPVNMDVISWLGAFHVKNEVYEKAMPYFDLASKIQPQEVKWQLMVASCYRRVGAFPQARAQHPFVYFSIILLIYF